MNFSHDTIFVIDHFHVQTATSSSPAQTINPPIMKKTFKNLTLLLAVIAGGWLTTPTAFASNDTWVGNTDANWSTAANWTFSSGSAVNASGDYLIFGVAGGSGTTLNNDLTSYSFAGINFVSGASAYTFGGNGFSLAGGITNSAAAVQVINNNFTLTGNEPINAAGANITLDGIIDDAGHGYGIIESGTHFLILGASNTYSGPTLVQQGTLELNDPGSIDNSPITIGQAGSGLSAYFNITEAVGGVTNARNNLTINGDTVTGGNNFGTVTINGTSAGNTAEYFPTLTMQAGMLRGLLNNNTTAANLEIILGNMVRNHGTQLDLDRNGPNSGFNLGGSPIANYVANQVNMIITNVNGNPVANAMIGGGGTSGTATISVLPWASVNSSLATYDPVNGLRALATSEMVNVGSPVNDTTFNSLTSTQNLYFPNSGTAVASNNISCNAIEETGNTATINLQGTNTLTVVSGAMVSGVGLAIGAAPNDGFLALGAAEGQLHVANTRSATINACITGSGGLTVSFDDLNNTTTKAALGGTNTFTGVTSIVGNNTGMTLTLNSGQALQNSTLDYNNYGAQLAVGGTVTSLIFGGLKGSQNLAISVPLTLGGDGDSTTYGGVLSGSGSLTKIGTGTFTLTNLNTYAGGTTLTNGQLNINNGGTSAANSAIGTGALTLLGGTIDNTSGSAVTLAPNNAQTWNGSFTNAGSSSLNLGSGIVTLAGSSRVTVNAGTLTVGGAISGSGFSLTKAGGGTLTLSGASTYSGNTVISGGTLALTGGGSIANSPGITVSNGATLDVSALSSTFTLGAAQSLFGGGTVNGSASTTSGSKVYAGTDGGYGTNTFNNNLTLVSGAAAYFDLGTVVNGSNDLIVVNGSLTLNGNALHVKAPSLSSSLAAADYVLFTVSGAISGSFAATPTWDVQPVNFGNYTVVTSGNTVLLHHATTQLPSGAGFASPSSVNRNGTTTITVQATNGTYQVTGVTVNLVPIGGTSVALVEQSSSGSTSVWTNTVTIGASVPAGGVSLTATITDSVGNIDTTPISLTVLAGTATWNGASGVDSNWSDNGNWVGGTGPQAGDAVVFAGSTRTIPVMNQSYTLSSVTFASGAASFTVTNNASGGILTLIGNGVTNNSANAQALNVPMVMNTSQVFNVAGGGLVLGGVVSGSGAALSTVGTGALTLSGTNTYGGGTVVSSGTLVVANNSALGSGVLTLSGGSISNAAGVSYTVPNNVSLASTGNIAVGVNDTLTLSGIISGGSFTEMGAGSLLLTRANTFSGGATVSSGTLVVGNNAALGSGLLTVSGNGAIANAAGVNHVLGNAINLAGLAGFEVGTNDTLALSGLITNIGGLNISGGGTLSVGGTIANSYSGGTVLNASVLNVENTSVAALGSGTLALGGGTLEDNSPNSVTISNNVMVLTNTSTTLLCVNSEPSFTLAGNISGPGSLVVDAANTSYDTFFLTGSNGGFTGTFTENNTSTYIRLKLNAPSAGSPNAAFVFNNPNVDTESFTFGAGTFSMGSLSGTGDLRQDDTGTTTLSIGGLNTNATWGGVILSGGSGDQFAVVKVGMGIETFTGNNTYAGTNEVAAGMFEITDAQQAAQPLQVDDGATFGFMDDGSGNTAQVASMVVGTNVGASLFFTNIYAAGAPSVNITGGELTANGTCVVTLADTANLSPGNIYTLVEYGTFSGPGNFVLSPLPGSVVGGLINDPSSGGLLLSLPQNTAPTNITITVTGGSTLGLSWPPDYQGWVLETNNVGLATSSAWGIVSGSEYTTSESITIDPTQTNVFYRLVLP
jgi:fibronectin-binding autotransporter adhesin